MGTRQYYRINQKLELSLRAFKWSFQSVGWENMLSEIWCICTGYFQERKMHLSREMGRTVKVNAPLNYANTGKLGRTQGPSWQEAIFIQHECPKEGGWVLRLPWGLVTWHSPLYRAHGARVPVNPSPSPPSHGPESKNAYDCCNLEG